MRSSTLDELEQAAVARRPERFVVLLEEALGCSRQLAGAIVEDSTGEPLAVALAALGAANEVLVRILISNDLQTGASYQRIRALARLNNALNRNAATMVIAALRDEAGLRLGHKAPAGDSPVPAPLFTAAISVPKKADDRPSRILRK